MHNKKVVQVSAKLVVLVFFISTMGNCFDFTSATGLLGHNTYDRLFKFASVFFSVLFTFEQCFSAMVSITLTLVLALSTIVFARPEAHDIQNKNRQTTGGKSLIHFSDN